VQPARDRDIFTAAVRVVGPGRGLRVGHRLSAKGTPSITALVGSGRHLQPPRLNRES
jgi:hypothetical protein